MLNVVVGALLAAGLGLMSRWVLEGGIRRRNLHIVRDELELARLLDDDAGRQERLRAVASVRLERYLGPSTWQRIRDLSSKDKAILGTAAVTLVVASVAVVVSLVDALRGKTVVEGAVTVGLLGVFAGLGVAFVEASVQRLLDAALWRRLGILKDRRTEPSYPGPVAVSDERLAELGVTRTEFEAMIAERRARWAAERRS